MATTNITNITIITNIANRTANYATVLSHKALLSKLKKKKSNRNDVRQGA
jgi:hypothetical protein